MAKKKTKFNKATFKNGVLSYNYLGGEAGKGKGAVSIIKKGDDWFFADSSGNLVGQLILHPDYSIKIDILSRLMYHKKSNQLKI